MELPQDELLSNLLSQIFQVIRNFNPTEYRTNEIAIKKLFEIELESNQDDYVKKFIEFFKNVDLHSHSLVSINQIDSQNEISGEKKPGYKKLLELVNAVENRSANSVFIFFSLSNPIELIKRALEPYDLITEFKNLKGEKAARQAIRIFREVSEFLYSDYLNFIFRCVQVLENRTKLQAIPTFGTLSSQLPERLQNLGYKSLVDADAGWLRNASCHGDWIYLAENDLIRIRDNKNSFREFSSTDVFEKALGMYSMVAECFIPIYFSYIKTKIFKDWLYIIEYAQLNIDSLINGDQLKMDFIQESFENEFLIIANELKISNKA